MPDRLELRRGVYHDSVVLMRIGSQLRGGAGIEECLVAMATPLNLGLLGDLGFDTAVLDAPSPADLLIALRGESDASLEAALHEVAAQLDSRRTPGGEAGATGVRHRSLRTAVRAAGANLAIVSVPGPHAACEAMDALCEGANVMIFSDGVSLAEERRLKVAAAERGLLVMGPDCGTARLGGVGLAFCNDLRDGDVGLVAASGTGAQHLASLLDARGIGISAILGVGGRDMSDDIGGASALAALALLDADPATRHIVVLSKQPGAQTARRLEAAVASLATPVTWGLLGAGSDDLTSVARAVAAAREVAFAAPRYELYGASAHATGGQLVGLFSGGTLAGEAQRILAGSLGTVAGLDAVGSPAPAAIAAFDGHLVVDLGDDRLTVGRPHPMIDATLRREVIEALARHPAPRILMIDVVLGFGADPDPVGALAPALGAFLKSHAHTRVVVSFVGTRRDPQGYEAQWRKLAELGCDVYESNAGAAAAAAGEIAGGKR